MEPTKIILTHWGALEAKYGAGAARVRKAVADLVEADARRGIVTAVVGLDRAEELAPYGAAPVTDPRDQEGAKNAVDAIDEAARFHYYLLLGGPDIVPMQELGNCTGIVSHAAGTGDADLTVPSDMPYACDAPYSKYPEDFLYPSRVVGRLPDVLWARRPTFLLELLRLAAAAKPMPESAYRDWFALSAAAWKESSRSTAKAVFGSTSRLVLCPPREDRWTAADLSPRIHLINCHGGNMDDAFAGQYPDKHPTHAGEQPVAISARSLRGRITPGTVVAAECCYGAQLFDSSNVRNPTRQRDFLEVQWPTRGKKGIALEYLGQGARGFFGSTTVAYGPAEDNQHADVICRVFLQKVLEGASLGRSALEARIAYLQSVKWPSRVMWKTLAQFHLLGDPSIHPVAGGREERHRAVTAAAVRQEELERRRHRRERDRRATRALEEARQVFQEDEVPSQRLGEFFEQARKMGVEGKFVRALTLVAGLRKVAKGDPSLAAWRKANQVVMVSEAYKAEVKRLRGRSPFPRVKVFIAHYRNGKVAGVERLESR